MSGGTGQSNGDYVPDARLTEIFDAVEQQAPEVVEALCPVFGSLADLEERYADETLVGQGGLKEVYKAFDRRTRQWVALARLRRDRGLHYCDLFIREAWLISSLSHPNIIKVHDAGADENGRPFFTMDLKGSTTLADLVRAGKATAQADLLEVFQKVCEAVAYAHSEGVIHLDLKPENIQCDRFGEVLVCDWGLGQSLVGPQAESDDAFPRSRVESETLLGQVQGTLGYMAPEQVVEGRPKDERTDVFALGCVLHALLCGEPPFSGTMEEVVRETAETSVPPLRARYPDRRIPVGLEAVVLKATARRPDDRYASAVELKDDVHKYLTGYATGAEQPGFIREARLFFRRNWLPSCIAATALFVLTVLSVLFVQRLGRERLATEEERLRVNRLLEEVDLLSSEYESLSEQSAVSTKQLATELGRAAGRLAALGMSHRPLEAMQQADTLVDTAFSLDPGNGMARWQRFVLDCIRLDHRAALSHPSRPSSGQWRLANAFPHFAFNEQSRPSREQLLALFRTAFEQQADVKAHLEWILMYHAATVPEHTDLSRELNALLGVYNGGEDHVRLSYSPRDSSMTVWSDREYLALRTQFGPLGTCLLRIVPARKLRVETSGELAFKELNHLPVEELDVTACRDIGLSRITYLPQLRVFRMRKGQAKPEAVHDRIYTNEPFEIVEVE